jgi:hypothetical protein
VERERRHEMRILPYVLVATATAVAGAAATITYKSAAHVGIILLAPAASSTCAAAGADLIAGGDEKTAVWRVLNFCGGTPKVIAGHFTMGNKEYAALDCKPAMPKTGEIIGADINCTVNDLCRGYDFSFSVCIDGKKVVDPELRIKGTRKNGDCPELKAAEAEDRCEKATQ